MELKEAALKVTGVQTVINGFHKEKALYVEHGIDPKRGTPASGDLRLFADVVKVRSETMLRLMGRIGIECLAVECSVLAISELAHLAGY